MVYVPIRFVGESLDKKVEWDEKNGTIWVGKRIGSFDYLIKTFNARFSGRVVFNNVTKIAGTTYKNNGIRMILPLEDSKYYPANKSGSVEYNLNGKYTKLIGKVGINDYYKNSNAYGTFKVYADGKELVSVDKLRGGDLPKDIEADVTNAQKLKLVFERDDADSLDIDFVEGKLVY